MEFARVELLPRPPKIAERSRGRSAFDHGTLTSGSMFTVCCLYRYLALRPASAFFAETTLPLVGRGPRTACAACRLAAQNFFVAATMRLRPHPTGAIWAVQAPPVWFQPGRLSPHLSSFGCASASQALTQHRRRASLIMLLHYDAGRSSSPAKSRQPVPSPLRARLVTVRCARVRFQSTACEC